MVIVFLYIALAVIVGVAANSRGRSGLGWFLLAILISPLISGLLVLALRRIDREDIAAEKRKRLVDRHSSVLLTVPSKTDNLFEPDGVIRGYPYKVGEDDTVEALMNNGAIRFRNMEQFLAAAEGRDAVPPQATTSPPENTTIPGVKTTVLRVFRHSRHADKWRKYKILVNDKEVGVIARNSVLDFEVPTGRFKVTARLDWGRSRPLMIDARPNRRIEIEVSNNWGTLLGLWAITFGSGSYLTLKQLQ
jgi:hypothetical protein